VAYQQVIIGDTTNSGGTVTSPAQFILMVNGQFAAAIGAIEGMRSLVRYLRAPASATRPAVSSTPSLKRPPEADPALRA